MGPREDLLSLDEIVAIVRIANDLGIRKFRLTGGEPLVRRGVVDLVRALRASCQIDDLSMTTNGAVLPRWARDLKAAGLDRVNVSIDSLDPARFRWITRGGELSAVLGGIQAALDAGLHPVKTNTVVMGGVNDFEVPSLIEYLTIDKPIAARFIEYMPIGQAFRDDVEFVDLSAVRDQLARTHGLQPVTSVPGNGPARYWRMQGAMGTVGFITPLSDKYCSSCSRLRLDAHGTVRPCLAYDLGVSLRDVLRNDGQERVRELLRSIVLQKPREHHWEAGQVTPVPMSRLGG